jgi:hypothetical protein
MVQCTGSATRYSPKRPRIRTQCRAGPPTKGELRPLSVFRFLPHPPEFQLLSMLLSPPNLPCTAAKHAGLASDHERCKAKTGGMPLLSPAAR